MGYGVRIGWRLEGVRCEMVRVYRCGLIRIIRTGSRDELQVMRHRRVVDERVCNHDVCFFIANKDLQDDSRG